MEKRLDGKSHDNVRERIEELKRLFPEAVKEGRFDPELLVGLLEEQDETYGLNGERYDFTWKGKRDSLRLAQRRSDGTLRPAPDESRDWDTTQNLYIEGDNLEVMKLLHQGYLRSVKMIYIDPPYNTGNDFVYQDDFVMDNECLKNSKGWDQFDEILARIREIRASELRFYQKARDLFKLSAGYRDDKVATQTFFAKVWDKFRHTIIAVCGIPGLLP